MTMVRGYDPIWKEVDLTGHLFDDTFYLFILENDIPYIPSTTWQDPFGNVPWSNPIRFFANGTLPNNIYYDPDTVYRLEFRQGPTQSDPLIYLIENYVPGSSGDMPVDETFFSTDNQVSNPQFALINFASPLTLNSISTQIINLAPGWFLHLTGAGNVTLTQVLLNSAVVDPTNASYALQIQLSGSWTNAFLSQRFTRNGVLWANTYISSSIMALSGNAPQTISATIVDSQGNTVASVLGSTPLTETFNEYRGVDLAPASADTDFPPAAYIEYQLLLPNNCNITLSSVQLISGDVQLTYPYEQTTIERQIDQTYHNSFPIVPIGTIIDFGGFNTPLHYLLCDGAAYSRTTYNLLFQEITALETVTLTSTSPTFTVISGAKYRIGMGLEGTGIPAFTTIINISGNTITMASPATTTGPSAVRFYAAAPIYLETVTLTSTMSTFTVTSAANYGIGMAVTGSGIPSATIITNISGTTITISHAATITGASLLKFYGVGNGDASTTFNIYNLQDFVIAGTGGSLFGSNDNTIGASGGSAMHTLTILEMPAHTHPGVTPSIGLGQADSPGGGASLISGSGFSMSVASQGNSSPHSIVQQTMLMKKCIRFEY
jgi:hypothetical protein